MRKENNLVHMKVYYDEDTHRVLGAQFMSKHDVSSAIAALSIAIASDLDIRTISTCWYILPTRIWPSMALH